MEADSHLKVLGTTGRLARDVLRECARTKHCGPVDIWVFALLAKAASSGLAVRGLLEADHVLDAKLLVRSVFDAAVDLHYVLENPLRKKELLELLGLEVAEDAYVEAQFYAKAKGKSLQNVAKKLPYVGQVVEAHSRARQHKAFHNRPPGVKRKDWPIRWRCIPQKEKLRGLKFAELWKQTLRFTITQLGNAVAHSRYLSLTPLMKQQADRSVQFVLRPKGTGLFAEQWTAFEATICLLLCTDKIINDYYLDPRFERRVQRILGRLQRLSRAP